MKKPLCVFRVYFKPEFRPFAAAEFELIAIPAADPVEAMRLLDQGFGVRGWRLIGWPAPDQPGVRLIDRVFSYQLIRNHIIEIRACDLVCTFRVAGGASEPAAEAV